MNEVVIIANKGFPLLATLQLLPLLAVAPLMLLQAVGLALDPAKPVTGAWESKVPLPPLQPARLP